MIEAELIPTTNDTLTLQTSRSYTPVNIGEKLRAYYEGRNEDDSDRSWEYCYRYFHHANPEAIKVDRHQAALQLGLYLASWGMYRGSGFLLKYAYTAHLGVVDCLLESKFSTLWSQEFGARDKDADLAPLLLEACEDVRTAYRPFAKAQGKNVTDMLVTKVALGAMGCFPALDKYFNEGCKHSPLGIPKLNAAFIEKILRFCRDNLQAFQAEHANKYQMGCPLMKLVDAYFHQIGLELEPSKPKKTKKKQNERATTGKK